MPEGREVELWRVQYDVKAYVDQTGKVQPGFVVYEQIVVVETGNYFDYEDGYRVYPNHVREVKERDGTRVFHLWSETCDYSGGTHVKKMYELPIGVVETGYWWHARRYRRYSETGEPWNDFPGYCYFNGSGPVIPLLDPDA